MCQLALSDVDAAESAAKLVTNKLLLLKKLALSDVDEADSAAKLALSNFQCSRCCCKSSEVESQVSRITGHP